jgi:hypothetical protein
MGTYRATGSFAGNTNYLPSSATANLTINCPATPHFILPAVAGTSYATSNGSGSVPPSVSKPSGTSAGELLVVGLVYEKGAGSTPSAPVGWNWIQTITQGNNVGLATYWKVATANEPPTYVFGLTNSPKWSIGISRIVGADAVNPVDAKGKLAGSKSTTATAPSITTTVCNTLVMAYYANKRDAYWTAPAGTTELYDAPNTQQGLTSNMMAWYERPTAGATGNKNATSSISEVWVAQHIAIRAAGFGSAGSRDLSDPVAEEVSSIDPFNSQVQSLTTYPNPVADRVSVLLPELEEAPANGSVGIYDRSARSFPVMAAWDSGERRLDIDFSQMHQGLYLIRVITPEGVKVARVFKQ